MQYLRHFQLGIRCLFVLALVSISSSVPAQKEHQYKALSKFIKDAESKLREGKEKLQYKSWAFASNITDHNEKNKLEAEVSQARIFLFLSGMK